MTLRYGPEERFSLLASKSRDRDVGSLIGFGQKLSVEYEEARVAFEEASEGIDEEVVSEWTEAVVGSDWKENGFCNCCCWALYLALSFVEPVVLLIPAVFGLKDEGDGRYGNEGGFVHDAYKGWVGDPSGGVIVLTVSLCFAILASD
ncbi:hypothetical protein OGAPHI_005062 [Ogataea philodendri]|uniref:Uncharacterized protein n=1 Tax=Ogataea philodendri TaxID=1378263 RepID=A0A9P8T2H2_9ASCO|nr:uncharacterized protein OGAPHI_005062 [Ogataea philodendri]KAH3663661.1 hypothetical protein OGAPHI_005062 [Ogataea philodendri]